MEYLLIFILLILSLLTDSHGNKKIPSYLLWISLLLGALASYYTIWIIPLRKMLPAELPVTGLEQMPTIPIEPIDWVAVAINFAVLTFIFYILLILVIFLSNKFLKFPKL